MSRAQRLSVVIDLAKRDEDAAAKALDEARQVLEAEQQRLADLHRYYEEYEQQFNRKGMPLRTEDLSRQRDFLQQLTRSCDAQAVQVKQLQAAFDQAVAAWQQVHLRHKQLCDYVAQLHKQELAQLDKKEQKRIDEWVAQRYARK